MLDKGGYMNEGYASQKDYEESEGLLDEAVATTEEGDFSGEVFLSTDGKNTVHITANTKQGRKAGLVWAKAVYEGLRGAYGTKQAQAVKEYSKEEDLGKCKDCGAPNKRSMKGKVYCSAKCWLK